MFSARTFLGLGAVMVLMLAPAAADAATVRYSGNGTADPQLDVSFRLVDREQLRRLSFNDVFLRCTDGSSGRLGPRTFRFPIRLNRNNEFRAAGRRSFGGGVERARARGEVRVRRGRAVGDIRVQVVFNNGVRCGSGLQPWTATR
jgi:hypothetical protein